MKKILILSIFLLAFSVESDAQISLNDYPRTTQTKDSLSWNAWFIVNPAAILSFEDGIELESGGTQFLFATSISNKNWFCSINYSFSTKDVGLLVSRTLIKDKKDQSTLSAYAIQKKSLVSSKYYFGTGITTPFGPALGFLEFGTNYGTDVLEGEKKPIFVTGLFISFPKPIKKWVKRS